MKFDIQKVTDNFQVSGEFYSAEPYGTGHINDTFAVRCCLDSDCRLYLLQRINHSVFKNVPALMENISRVCSHVREKLLPVKGSEIDRYCLSLIRAIDGGDYYHGNDGNYWRMYNFVTDACAYDTVISSSQAYEAARAFGNFLSLIADMPSPQLHETIPGFHNTPQRYCHFKRAVNEDIVGRAVSVRREIDFYLSRYDLACSLHEKLINSALPRRICHNDTKLNNLLMDSRSGEALCVIDLDTLMPGLAAYDFGDLVRTSTSPVAEDEPDYAAVCMQMDMFKALAEGFVDGAGSMLNADEFESLPAGGMVITYECGMRFLTDYLCGDKYYKTSRPGHNLDRARTQMALVTSMEAQKTQIQQFIAGLRKKCVD